MKSMKCLQGELREVSIDTLEAHPIAQRRLKKRHYKNMIAHFLWAAFGIPVVIRHALSPKFWWVIDGWHRINALKESEYAKDENGDPVKIAVLIIDADADIVFAILNGIYEGIKTRMAVTAKEIFYSHFQAERPDQRFIVATLNSYGIDVGFDGGRARVGQTKNPHVFLDLYRKLGKKRFQEFVNMLVEAFSRPDQEAVEEVALSSDWISGWTMYLQNHGNTFTTITSAMLAANLSAAEIKQRAKTAAEAKGSSRWVFIAELANQFDAIVNKYETGN